MAGTDTLLRIFRPDRWSVILSILIGMITTCITGLTYYFLKPQSRCELALVCKVKPLFYVPPAFPGAKCGQVCATGAELLEGYVKMALFRALHLIIPFIILTILAYIIVRFLFLRYRLPQAKITLIVGLCSLLLLAGTVIIGVARLDSMYENSLSQLNESKDYLREKIKREDGVLLKPFTADKHILAEQGENHLWRTGIYNHDGERAQCFRLRFACEDTSGRNCTHTMQEWSRMVNTSIFEGHVDVGHEVIKLPSHGVDVMIVNTTPRRQGDFNIMVTVLAADPVAGGNCPEPGAYEKYGSGDILIRVEGE